MYAHALKCSRDYSIIYYHIARTRLATCSMMYPEFLDHSDTFNTTPARPQPPPYVLPSAPAASSVVGDQLTEDEPPPAYRSPRVSTTAAAATMFTTAYAPPIRNRTVRTINPNVQIPDTYPGFAFCKFTPGKIETVIRLTVVVRA